MLYAALSLRLPVTLRTLPEESVYESVDGVSQPAMRYVFKSFGVSEGFLALSTAAALETSGAAWDVPLNLI